MREPILDVSIVQMFWKGARLRGASGRPRAVYPWLDRNLRMAAWAASGLAKK